ncbi:restriction endonuclease subunit S [Shewanella morhuae]|uniref:restriction endonuclease subunit S n=1 Tax=Shewanella morhuae TaxID=365591 RepID=UPI001BC3BCFB|nr:restriction endonuclease subunit S [Shewanella morhuae]GIU01814.1 hypothetical protein TUM4641_00720 [Shewanella morhuae]
MRNSTFKLGDITEVITKGTTPTSVGFKFVESGINFVKVESITADGLFLTSKFASISDECNKTLKRSQLQEGDVLFSIAGALGRTVLVPKSILPANTNQALAIIRLKSDIAIDKRFLLLALQTSVTMEQVEKYRGGVAQQNLSLGQLKNFEIPDIPISNQKRIVAIIDQAFADIEQTRAKTEQNLKNTRELFLSEKQQMFSDLEAESEIFPLNSVCNGIFAGGDAPGKGLFSKHKTEKFTIPIFANAVKDNGLYGFTDFSRVQEPSITIAARGSGTGHIELRTDPFLPIVRLIVLTPNENILLLEYFKLALQNLDILRSGSAIPQLTVPMIKGYSIPIPAIPKQLNIVAELKKLEVLIDELNENYKNKLQQLDELKKSILQKAFAGELSKSNA